MSFERRCAGWLLTGAERLIPPAKAEWARAMTSEGAYLPNDRSLLGHAAGCVRAAGIERIRSLAPDGAWFWPGAAFGTLLLASAMIPHSRMLPMIWAVLGGAVAVLMLGERGRAFSFLGVVGIGFKAGLLSGLQFAVAAPLLLLATGHPVSLGRLGLLVIAGVMVTFMTTVGAVAVAPLVCRRPGAGND